MATLPQIMDALATQIDTVLSPLIDDLQVDGRLIPNPTPPAIDVYPGDPFVESLGFGAGNKEMWFTVRARVGTSDNEAGQDLLLQLMDPTGTESMEQAILAGRTLGGVADVAQVEGPSNYGLFPSGPDTLLGCTWRVRVIP